MSIIGNLGSIFNAGAGSATVGTSSNGITWTNIGVSPAAFPQLTTEEKNELDNLEKELQSYIKQNRLKRFQELPKHIRQEIVDEAYIRDFLSSMNENLDSSFQDATRLSELRNKRDMANGYYIPSVNLSSALIAGNYHHTYPVMGGKYGHIVNLFNTKELAEAHAQASLEESLD